MVVYYISALKFNHSLRQPMTCYSSFSTIEELNHKEWESFSVFARILALARCVQI